MGSIVGTYELLSSPEDKNWDEYMIATSVSDEHREVGRMVKPAVEISAGNDIRAQCTLKTLSEAVNTETTFTAGQQCTEQTWDGRTVKSTFTIEGNRVVQIQEFDGKTAKIVREFSTDGMTETLSSQGKIAVRKYKRVG